MSEKKLKDYIGYYIGCRCLNTWFPEGHEEYDKQWILTGYNRSSVKCFHLDNEEEFTRTDSIKLILRLLGGISESECWELHKIDPIFVPGTSSEYIKDRLYLYREKCITFRHISPLLFHFLIQKGFDLFGLIESGLAIDTSTLNLK